MQHDAQQRYNQQELSFAKSGIGWGLFAGLGWGLDGILMGIALGLAPFDTAAGLFAVPLVAACLHDGSSAVWIYWKNYADGRWRDYYRTLRTKPVKYILLASVIGGPIAMSCNYLGVYFAGPSYTAAITAAYPAIGALLSAVFLKEKISPRVWLGIVTAVAGSLIVGYVPPAGEHPHFYLGILMAAVAAIGWALEGVLSTHGMDIVDADIAIGIRQITSFVGDFFVILPIFGFTAYKIFFTSFTTPAFWSIFLIALLGASSTLSWYRAMNMTGVGRAMGLNITYAFWSVFFGWLITGLQLTPSLLTGVALIFFGTIITIGNPKELTNLRSKEGEKYGATADKIQDAATD